MEFRPCIDIHNGKVKQIVGGSLQDLGNQAQENFVSGQTASFYGNLYKKAGLKGGHIILLNSADSEYYEATRKEALSALRAYPGGLQVGGGINPENCKEFIEAGASHVIVTSYVFRDGRIHFDRLKKMVEAVGKDRLVLDMSCRKVSNDYMVVTDRWQKITEEKVDKRLLDTLASYCDEFLIHAVDVEGRSNGVETELIKILGEWLLSGADSDIAVTYAGGIHSYDDLTLINELGGGRINFTIGSALDIFGGNLQWDKILEIVRGQ